MGAGGANSQMEIQLWGPLPRRIPENSYWMWSHRKKGTWMRKEVNRGRVLGVSKRWGARKREI